MAQRLIDAERLKRHYSWWGQKASAEIFKEFKHTFDIIVDLQPTVATPEIVRCKECKHYKTDGWCIWDGEEWRPDEYCSRGERIADDEESTKRTD